jgi:putative DNA primase/helicase
MALLEHHKSHLTRSAISSDVIGQRGYETLDRRENDGQNRRRLKRLGFSSKVYKEGRRFPGILIPLYGPTGQITSYQYRPDHPRREDNGKRRKYEAVKGRASVLDVHPFNRDAVVDPTVPLGITEGVKKGDAITSASRTEGVPICMISLAGVFNFRSQQGALGDWEDVQLKGREVYVVFDSDTATNRNVARAMKRLGAFLRSRGAAPIKYVVTPPVNGDTKSGADDFLASGRPLRELLDCAASSPPDPDAGDDSLTEARLAEKVADETLTDRFRWCPSLGGWHEWEGTYWRACGEEIVVETVSRWIKDLLKTAVDGGATADRQRALVGLQSRARIANIVALTRGIDGIVTRPEDFDADPWLLNCGNGVVDLTRGELLDHDPTLLMRHKTAVNYLPDARHNDWATALGAFADKQTEDWAQVYLGTGCVGLTPREDVLPFWHGLGSNGKSTIVGAVKAALGSYGRMVLPTLLGGRREEHPTQVMDLLGLRFGVIEELNDGHRLDVAAVKRIQGTETITARKMRQDSVEFTPSHTLIVTTNYRPIVPDTDHGTWRRLLMVPFPHEFGRQRHKDPGLRTRLQNEREQQEAVLAWLVEGAIRWYENEQAMPVVPEAVDLASREWRYDSDLLAQFIDKHLTGDPEGFLEMSFLLRLFNVDLQPPSSPWTMRTFSERLGGHDLLRAIGARRDKHPRTRRSGIVGVAWTGEEFDAEDDLFTPDGTEN